MLTYFFNLKQPQSPLQNTKSPTNNKKPQISAVFRLFKHRIGDKPVFLAYFTKNKTATHNQKPKQYNEILSIQTHQ